MGVVDLTVAFLLQRDERTHVGLQRGTGFDAFIKYSACSRKWRGRGSGVGMKVGVTRIRRWLVTSLLA
jgi:hypothetical protein